MNYAFALTKPPTVIDEATHRVAAVASTETPDGDGDIIRVQGWNLSRVAMNQVKLLNAHNARDIRDVLGKIVLAEKSDVLTCEVSYAVNESELAAFAWKMTKGGFLSGYSVGARPLAVASLRDVKAADGSVVKANKKLWDAAVQAMGLDPKATAENVRKIVVAAELAELSALGVPSNPEAMVKALGAGAVREEDFARIGLAGADEYDLITKGAEHWGRLNKGQRENFSDMLCGISRNYLQTKETGTGATEKAQRARVEPEENQRAEFLETCKTLAAKFAEVIGA